jgi:hypothetical protein
MKLIVEVLKEMKYGESYVCTHTGSGFHNGGEYQVHKDTKGVLHLVNDFGNHVYPGMTSKSMPCFLKAFESKNRVSVKTERLSKEEIDMTPSKVKEVINRLNGVKPSEEKLVDLRQVTSSKKTFELDLAHMLANAPSIKELKPGEECLVTGLDVDLHNGKVAVHLSTGKVDREGNSAVAAALTDLVNGQREE